MAGGLRIESIAELPPAMRQQLAGKLMANRAAASAELVAQKESKYHNKKATVNDVHFDSKKEARRYAALLEAVRCGLIYDLWLQHEFTLQEAYTTAEGERIRAIRYRADFTYRVGQANYGAAIRVGFEDLDFWRSVVEKKGRGAMVVEDVKSRATKTGEYMMKRKMMADLGHIIREV